MKLVTYEKNDLVTIGALADDKVVDLVAAFRAMSVDPTANFPRNVLDLLNEGPARMAHAQAAVAFAQEKGGELLLDRDTINFLPPIPRPGKVICLGRNYAAHAKEGGAEPPDYPMLFYKPATALLGHKGTIVIPPITERVDYEGELAIVIGKTCKQIAEEDALDYVAGYSVANDVSARDLQRRTSQFTAGKMLDTFGPIGPALVTKDEIPDAGNLWIRTVLNGRLMQDGTTSNMIFTVPFTVAYISQIATLEVGDIIMTGTPEGVGFARKPPVYLKAGDEISVEIEGLGVLQNSVIEE